MKLNVVRMNIAANPNVSTSILKGLLKDKNENVRFYAKESLLKRGII